MANPKIKIHNVETGEVVEREMTATELENLCSPDNEATTK